MALKRTQADKWFSDCVRQRNNYTCELCETYYPPSASRGGLHTSHYFTRANYSVRHYPDNAFCLCWGCHQKLGSNPHDHREFVMNKLGQGRYEKLLVLRNDNSIGKCVKKQEKQISKHYREEFRAMEREREDNGNTGYLDFEPYINE